MEISPNERDYHRPPVPNRRTGQLVVVVIAIAIIALGAWWFMRPEPEPEMETIPVEPVTTVVEPEPAVTQPNVAATEPEPEPESKPKPEATADRPELPALDDSDKMVRETLSELSSDKLYKSWLKSDNLVRRGTAVTDGIARGKVLHKFLPVKPPSGKFLAIKKGQIYWLDPANYDRYDTLVETLVSIEPEQAVQTIHLLKPLIESAFAEQGYKDRTFDGTLLSAIDQLLETPVYDRPPQLKLESVYFKFKDDAIEGLSEGQKQLVRSGPANTRKIQDYLRKLRAELVRK